MDIQIDREIERQRDRKEQNGIEYNLIYIAQLPYECISRAQLAGASAAWIYSYTPVYIKINSIYIYI